MNVRTRFFVALFAVSALFFISRAWAQSAVFNVQHDGVTQFCAPGIRVTGDVYNFVGTCSTPPPPTTCTAAANCLARANVLYVGHDAAPLANVDLTQWAPTWGRFQASNPALPWPSARGATPQWRLGRGQYTCAAFNAVPTSGANLLSMASYHTAGNLEASLSSTCGDFSMPVGGCHKKNVGAFASSFFKYEVGVATTAYICGISGPAYLNLRWTDGAPSEPGGAAVMCNTQGCLVAVTSNTSPPLQP